MDIRLLEFIATGWLIDCPYKPRYLMKSWLYTWWYFCTAACVKGLQITTFMGIRVYVNKWVLYKFRCSLQYICLRGVRCCCGKYGILLDDRWGSPNWTDCSDEAWDLSFFSRVASGNKWKYRWPAKRYFLYRINFYCGKYCKKARWSNLITNFKFANITDTASLRPNPNENLDEVPANQNPLNDKDILQNGYESSLRQRVGNSCLPSDPHETMLEECSPQQQQNINKNMANGCISNAASLPREQGHSSDDRMKQEW